jgi:phosphonate transport system substrate-binding protein
MTYRQRLFSYSILFFLTCSSVFFPGNAYCADDPLVMGIFPRRSAKATLKFFTPFAKYLSEQLKRKVVLETTKDFQSFWENVAKGRYDIVHYNQLHYIQSHKQFGYDVIAKNEEFGKSTLAGALVVRKDSGINKLSDLKGKKIVFGGGKKAMVAYIAATALLRRAGLNDRDYVEEFAKNPPNATFSAYYRQAAAGGTGDIGLSVPIVKNRINVDDMKFLAIGEALPHLPWAVKDGTSPQLRQNIQHALLNLNNSKEGKAMLKNAAMTGISAAVDKDFDICRHLIQEVLGSQ